MFVSFLLRGIGPDVADVVMLVGIPVLHLPLQLGVGLLPRVEVLHGQQRGRRLLRLIPPEDGVFIILGLATINI